MPTEAASWLPASQVHLLTIRRQGPHPRGCGCGASPHLPCSWGAPAQEQTTVPSSAQTGTQSSPLHAESSSKVLSRRGSMKYEENLNSRFLMQSIYRLYQKLKVLSLYLPASFGLGCSLGACTQCCHLVSAVCPDPAETGSCSVCLSVSAYVCLCDVSVSVCVCFVSVSVCIFVCVCLCMSLFISVVCLCVYLCFCVSVSFCVSLCICVSVHMCVSVSVCVSIYLHVCLCLCVSLFLCVSLCICVSVCISVCVCLCFCVSLYICIVSAYVCLCSCVCLCISACVFVLMCVVICVPCVSMSLCVCACAHVHMHVGEGTRNQLFIKKQ